MEKELLATTILNTGKTKAIMYSIATCLIRDFMMMSLQQKRQKTRPKTWVIKGRKMMT